MVVVDELPAIQALCRPNCWLRKSYIAYVQFNVVIAPFNGGGVLPPFLSAEPGSADQSPYQATMLELVERFASTEPRCDILTGLFNYRAKLRALGICVGFQWIDGSFVEDAERVKGRAPGDIDVVTIARRPAHARTDGDWEVFIAAHEHDIFSSSWTKSNYRCDAYPIDLDADAEAVVQQSAYWFGLFSHQRITLQWKGIVTVRLEEDDASALTELGRKVALCR